MEITSWTHTKPLVIADGMESKSWAARQKTYTKWVAIIKPKYAKSQKLMPIETKVKIQRSGKVAIEEAAQSEAQAQANSNLSVVSFCLVSSRLVVVVVVISSKAWPLRVLQFCFCNQIDDSLSRSSLWLVVRLSVCVCRPQIEYDIMIMLMTIVMSCNCCVLECATILLRSSSRLCLHLRPRFHLPLFVLARWLITLKWPMRFVFVPWQAKWTVVWVCLADLQDRLLFQVCVDLCNHFMV